MKKTWVYLLFTSLALGSVMVPEYRSFDRSLIQPQAKLCWSKLDHLYLYRVNLSNAGLSGSTMNHSNLEKAQLTSANLRWVDLSYSSLKKANLRGADLRGANLSYSDLRGAYLYQTNYKEANLEYAIWIDGSVCQEGSIGKCIKGKKFYQRQ
jgi:uncharacterized protein YjbI with pentapeptide repeats